MYDNIFNDLETKRGIYHILVRLDERKLIKETE